MISQVKWTIERLAILCLVTFAIALSLATGVEAAPEKGFVANSDASIFVLDESGETGIGLACASYDFVNDGFIDLDDINAVLSHSIFAGASYDPLYDLSPDGVVDIADIFEVALHFGEPCPIIAIEIEVDDGTGFRSLDYALVGATEPILRVSGDLPPDFRVFNNRPDGRVGLDGGGREITVEFTETTAGVWEATLSMLIGQNTIVVTDSGGVDAQVSATMFNYNLVFEDVNGNGLLDTGEDLDHDGELDVGEDQNGNGELDLSEDVNDNGMLDLGEDFNGNQLLDFNEDLNGDGFLNVDEDFNDNGVLDEGEDWNANDEIDGLSLGVSANYDSDPADYAMIPGPELFYSTIVIDLDAVDSATDVALSDLLRDFELRPIGIVVDNTIETKAKLLTVTLPAGADALEIVKTLNDLPIAGFDFAPPLASLPVGDPLEIAVLILAGAEPPQAAGEAMPTRLINGAAALPSAGNAGDVYNAATGGFDNDNDGGATDFDELNIFVQHFFYDTFAAHRLVDVLVSGVATPSRPLVALVDTGLGNGGNVLTDIAGARIMRPTRCPLGACSVVPLSGIPDAWAVGASNGDHGTAVAHLAAGGGQRILGTGKDIAIRPIKASGNMDSRRYTQGLQVAAADAAVRVIVLEYQTGWYDFNGDGAVTNTVVARASGPANELQTAVNALNNARPHWLPAINALLVANPTKILVIPAGNASQNTAFSILAPAQATAFGNIGGLFNAPTRGARVAGSANSLVMGIGNATLSAMPLGQEQRDSGSNFGPQISVTSLSQNVPSLDPAQNFQSFGGTSGAAPQVAGLAGELIYLDDNLATVGPFSSLQIVELIEASADDLGNNSATAALLNNNPGDGSDNTFGHGRINAWKATLSAVNGGVAEESHPAGSGFGSLTRKNEANTKWYGFKIHSPIRGATVWVDGVQVTDAGATAPGGITAYAGVKTNAVMQIGVKDDADAILDEDPTTGIVPAGSQSNYVATFSIERSDLVKAGGNKVLTVRIPGRDDPYLNLELDLTEMRKGKIPGVTFDDFVFEITPPDFGDAVSGYPTSLADNGARHLHSALEWFGGPSTAIDGVSPEFDVQDEYDPDGVGNWSGELVDLDGLDNGVVFFPLTYTPGGKGVVEFEVCVSERGDRYNATTQDKQLFVNGWIDWNTNTNWHDNANEHIIDGLRLAPINDTNWGPINAMPTPNGTTIVLKLVLGNCGTYKATFDVPANIGTAKLWSRFRLDYGENVGRHNNSLFKKHAELNLTRGPAYYGEVEDYLIGSDFGDAGKDPPYQTRLSSNGPRHLQIYREWIGPYQAGESSATREPDACGVGSADQDGGGNISTGCSGFDADKKDDFRVFVPTPGKFIVEFEVSSTVRGYGFNGGHGGVATMKPDCSLLPMAATPGSPAHQTSDMRYDAGTTNERLYVNLWADWEGDGGWDTHLIPGLPVDPEDFGADGKYTLGEPFTDSNGDGVWNDGETYTDVAGTPTRFFSCLFDGFPPLGMRLRLDYGENAGALGVPRIGDPFEEFPIHIPAGTLGGAAWGEVEDKVGLPGVPHIELPPMEIPLGVPVTTGPVDTAILPGTGPYSFYVVEQTIPGDMPNTPLPDGLSIDTATGEISGETLVPGITWPLIWVFDVSLETPELVTELWQHFRVPLHLTIVKVDADTMQPRQGTTMTLHQGSGCTEVPLQTKITDETGMIWFDDLDPEIYSVQDAEEPEWTPITSLCQDIDLTNFEGVSALPVFNDSYPTSGNDLTRAAAGLWLQTGQDYIVFSANGIIDVWRSALGDVDANQRNDIQTLITAMDMVGDSSVGPIQLDVDPSPTNPSYGLIEEVQPGSFFPANAAFATFLEIMTPNGVLNNMQPLFLQAIPPLKQLPLAGSSFAGGNVLLDDDQGQFAGQIVRMLLLPLLQDEAGLVFMTIPEN